MQPTAGVINKRRKHKEVYEMSIHCRVARVL